MDQAAPQIQLGGLEMGLMGVGGILSLIALVCSIMVAVKMMQNNQTGLGIASIVLTFCTGIGYLITLIVGWMKSAEWNIKGLMTAYTACLLIGFALLAAGYGMMMVKVANQIQNDPQFQQQMQQIQQEMNNVQVEPAAP